MLVSVIEGTIYIKKNPYYYHPGIVKSSYKQPTYWVPVYRNYYHYPIGHAPYTNSYRQSPVRAYKDRSGAGAPGFGGIVFG